MCKARPWTRRVFCCAKSIVGTACWYESFMADGELTPSLFRFPLWRHMRTIVLVDYDSAWPEIFQQLRSIVWPVVSDFALSIEHVGSTAVPGLAAKPIIDMSVVIPSQAEVEAAIERLATLGYL